MKKLLLVFPIFLLVAACHSSTDTTLNGGTATITTGSWIIPSVGTEYIYEGSPADSTASPFDTLTIIRNGQHIGGKTNAVVLFASQGADTGIYDIEPNGDFSFGDSVETDTGGSIQQALVWDTYPTGSRQTTNVMPSVDSFDAEGDHIISSDICSFVGTENAVVPAGTFSTLHVREITINDDIVPNDSENFGSTDTSLFDIWFVPSVGLYVKFIDQEISNGQPEQPITGELLKYLPH